jgi:hypothetical protein
VALDGHVVSPAYRQEPLMDAKTLIVAILVVAVGVLGYLWYDSQQAAVKIDVPGVKIEAN